MTINDGGPAFPRVESYGTTGRLQAVAHSGMTLREWYAGQALAGVAHERYPWHDSGVGRVPVPDI